MSKLLFITNMVSTPDEIIKEANAIFFKFLWNGPDKVKRDSIVAEIEYGGMKYCNKCAKEYMDQTF